METKLTGIYIVDHPDRDLNGYIWWTLYNKVDPGTVYLIPMNEMNKFTILRLKPNYIVWNYARPNNEKLIKFAKKFGVINIIHDTEGIPYNVDNYFSSASNYLIKNIDLILAWGEIQSYSLREKLTPINPGLKIINFGSLRYEYIKSLPKVALENNFGVFLWNCNFPSLSPKYQSNYSEFCDSVFRDKSFSGEEYLNFLIATAEERNNSFSKITQLLKNKLELLLVRPHPFESSDYYKKKFIDEYSFNIRISSDGDVHDDLINTNLIFQSGCQTTLDAYLRGIPSVSLGNKNNIWSKLSIPYDLYIEKEWSRSELLQIQSKMFRELKFEDYLNNLNIDLNENEFKNFLYEISNLNNLNLKFIFIYKIKIKINNYLSIFKNKLFSRKVGIENFKEKKKISSLLIINKLNSLTGLNHKSNFGYAEISTFHKSQFKSKLN